ncbi:MAG: hypothetical protein CPSOU_1807 [uncultured Paraburkholderia sp.]|nr:MAG: hypothetical protein CPSOU_1807 [uncultured Paraburkholderia sp.]
MSVFVPGLLVGYGLGIVSMCGLVGLYLLHRPRYVAPTKRRKYRDAPVVQEPKVDKEEGVDYRWINIAGEQE